MAHFAELNDSNIVVTVNVLNNEVINNLPFPDSEPIGIEFFTEWSGGYSNWRQTSYNGNFRKNYAIIGGIYDPIRDAFIAPQPYPSWILNETTCQWEAPVAYPTDDKAYTWDEATTSWVEA